MTVAHVADTYGHYVKQAEYRELLRPAADVELKYYHLIRPGEPVPPAVEAAARAFLLAEVPAALAPGGDHGFVILHRCGADFYFLLLGVWRGSNELWEAVWYLDAGMDDFAGFPPAYGAPLRPTFCVWEFGIVAHESAAWTRFLASSRGEADLERWRGEIMNGAV